MTWKGERNRHALASRGIKTKLHAQGSWGYKPQDSDDGQDSLYMFVREGQNKKHLDELYTDAKQNMNDINSYLTVIEFLNGSEKYSDHSKDKSIRIKPTLKLTKTEMKRAIKLMNAYLKTFKLDNGEGWSDGEERVRAINTIRKKYVNKVNR